LNVKLFVVLVSRWKHQVTVARNGYEAVDLFERQDFDLVLMDVQMPGMDGLQATAAIREKESHSGQHIPIIALTAHALPEDRQRCLAAGMDGYVTKPISQRVLCEAIKSVWV
jgi:two-component system sensor histidine kinase/response regulator